jgi:Domain of unknown function (DUF4402)
LQRQFAPFFCLKALTMRLARQIMHACSLVLLLLPVGARAEPGNSQTFVGQVRVEVIDPGRMMLTRDLRYGAFIQPTAAGTITVAPNGTVTGSATIAPGMVMVQPSEGRGPALVLLDGTSYRSFTAILPNRVDISNGTATMRVSNITTNISPGTNRFDAGGHFDLWMGGRLNVAANQAVGEYTGNFTITVIFH